MKRQMEHVWARVREEDVAAGLHAVRMSKPRLSDGVAVVGDHSIALATAGLLFCRGVTKLVLLTSNSERATVGASVGLRVFQPPASTEQMCEIRKELGEFGSDVTYCCDETSEITRLAIEITRPAGMIIILTQGERPISVNPNLLVFEDKRVKGSGSPDEQERQIAHDLITTAQVE